jgi:hypothetical protein
MPVPTAAPHGAADLPGDVTDAGLAGHCKAQASRCRRLAGSINDEETIAALQRLAGEYDQRARTVERPH